MQTLRSSDSTFSVAWTHQMTQEGTLPTLEDLLQFEIRLLSLHESLHALRKMTIRPIAVALVLAEICWHPVKTNQFDTI